MSAVSSNTSFPTPGASAPTNAGSSAAGGSNGNNTGVITDQASLDATENQFLTLLTTQLKNQDPTSPMDTSQFTSELVSMSGVEQQLTTNADLGKLVAASGNNQTQLGLSYIGLDVSVQGNQFTYNPTADSSVTLGYSLASAAATNKISVLDSNSNVVYTGNGSLSAGSNTFTWNGKETDGTTAPAGLYTIQVSATSATNTAIAATTIVPGQVTGMETASDGTVQLVINNATVVPLANVESATLPPQQTAAQQTPSDSSTTN